MTKIVTKIKLYKEQKLKNDQNERTKFVFELQKIKTFAH